MTRTNWTRSGSLSARTSRRKYPSPRPPVWPIRTKTGSQPLFPSITTACPSTPTPPRDTGTTSMPLPSSVSSNPILLLTNFKFFNDSVWFQRDTHPERAAYILAQAPLENTVGDFWQMVWEQRCTVAVLFAGTFDTSSGLTSDGLPQFWPGEGNAVYHNFEVHLVSEHVWCGEYLVRSLYLKNLLTSQTRTVTLFHYLLWLPHRCPETGPRPLLEFRR